MPIGWAILGAGALNAYTSYQAGQDVASATESAADIQAKAAEEALAFQKQVYGDIQPYLMESLSGYQNLLNKPEAYKETPGYLFRLQEGLKAAGIPEGGRNLSGPQVRRAIQYGQDYATSEYQNALARIAGLGNIAQGVYGAGQQYATNAGNIIMQNANNQATATQNAANARAAGYLGVGNAITSGVQNYALYNMYQNTPPASAGPQFYGDAYMPGRAY